MAEYDETQQALFEQIKRIAEDGGIERHSTHIQAQILVNLTRAFRYAAGGDPLPAAPAEVAEGD